MGIKNHTSKTEIIEKTVGTLGVLHIETEYKKLNHYVFSKIMGSISNEKIMKQGVIQRIVLNFAGQVLQMCVFPSLSILLLLSTPVSIVAALFLPVLLVWNLVYAFIILMKTENGSQPEATIQLNGHANWKWKKSK